MRIRGQTVFSDGMSERVVLENGNDLMSSVCSDVVVSCIFGDDVVAFSFLTVC